MASGAEEGKDDHEVFTYSMESPIPLLPVEQPMLVSSSSTGSSSDVLATARVAVPLPVPSEIITGEQYQKLDAALPEDIGCDAHVAYLTRPVVCGRDGAIVSCSGRWCVG